VQQCTTQPPALAGSPKTRSRRHRAGFSLPELPRMHVRLSRLLAALGLAAATACHSDKIVGVIDTPLPASLQVGDLVRLNVNGNDACTNGIYHVARVEAISDRAIILSDTLNPKNGFTTAEYQDYATKFDTLVYPLDEGAFGAPTDIDNNGRVGIVFTLAVNELTPAGSGSYVGGFTYSRDLFPVVASSRAEACPTSNQGEFFYALAPDPTGVVNNNRRTTGFVDSATVPVLAHELQHLINASRKLYVNTNATGFEVKWLDEGLAHIAEELLFYRESGITPRLNVDVTAIRASSATLVAFNYDMSGNASRYRSYLVTPSTTSPYAGDDSLSTRGAAWDWLRYLADQKMANVARSASADIELPGQGSVSVPGGAAGAEYYATLVNSSTTQDVVTDYGLTASGVIAPAPSLSPVGGATLNRMAVEPSMLDVGAPALHRDERFEAQLRARERAMLPGRIDRARTWYHSEISHVEVPQGGRYAVSTAIASPDADIWFRLVNNTAVGIANIQSVFGVDPSVAVSDWSASHAVDDVSSLVADQFLQKSWNWHSIYPQLKCSGCAPVPYPLPVQIIAAGSAYSGTVLSGGSTHFRFAVPPAGSATLTVTSSSATAAGLKLVIVRTK
jgi:hypothetical protein